MIERRESRWTGREMQVDFFLLLFIGRWTRKQTNSCAITNRSSFIFKFYYYLLLFIIIIFCIQPFLKWNFKKTAKFRSVVYHNGTDPAAPLVSIGDRFWICFSSIWAHWTDVESKNKTKKSDFMSTLKWHDLTKKFSRVAATRQNA
jgi:hypothetical protein